MEIYRNEEKKCINNEWKCMYKNNNNESFKFEAQEPMSNLWLAPINTLPSYAGDGPETWPRTLDSTRAGVRWKTDYIYSMLYSNQCQ